MRVISSTAGATLSPRNPVRGTPFHRPFRAESANAAGSHDAARRMHLTPRELEVLSLLSEGLSNKLICRRLNISMGTVKVYIGNILREMGVSSRLQAVVSAQRFGLVASSGSLGDATPGALA